MDMILILYVDNLLLLGEDLSKIGHKMSTWQIVSNEHQEIGETLV